MEIASDEIQPSWAQGFTHGWEVAEEYEITGGVLRGKGPSRRMYFPMMHPEIPGEVAKLRREDEAGVLEFARAYGSLGFSGLVPAERRCGGDPLPWIWAHAETLHIGLQLILFLQESDVDAL
ncbi:MAG TPA: hypothetical protein VF944_02345, partial [Candidatus Bathyarchaeia archaeon]